MTKVTVQEAQARLPELLVAASRGEEVLITQDSEPAIKLVPVKPPRPRPEFGSAKGMILYMAPDFDAPLEDFKEYMP